MQAGYALTSFEENRRLSHSFRGSPDKYSNLQPSTQSVLRGQQAFWQWMSKAYKDGEGLLTQLGFYVVDPVDRRRIKLQFQAKATTSLEQSEEILGFKVYTGEERDRFVKSFGWTDFSRPQVPSPVGMKGAMNMSPQQLQ